MVRIRVLPDDVVNRIAAGEVVERPASVVKELVENSLDAGATRVEVDLEQGGRTLVRVVDDGCGMAPDDVLLALERHATSKLGAGADLEHIATLGFRGEALPSIAAVSRLRLASSADPAEGGAQVVVEGGRILAVDAAARARGTTVEVRDLFFNLPARRKFLHAVDTELRHASEAFWGSALARPEIAFTLRHGPRTLVEVAPAADEASRLRDLLGGRCAGVRRAAAVSGGARVAVLVAEAGGGSRPALHLFVNRRPVRDRLLVGAVLRGLRDGGAAGSGLKVVAMLEVEPTSVDVNVHPAKAEVRFVRPGEIVAAVERAVREAVRAGQGEVPVRRLDTVVGEVAEALPVPYARLPASLFSHPVWGGVADAEEPRSAAGAHAGGWPSSGPADTPLGRLIGQYRRSFLLLEDEAGLVVVDQHVAHERVLYERFRLRLERGAGSAQGLLEPVLLEVGEALAGALSRVAALLGRAGLEVEPFGPATLRLAAVPSELGVEGARELVVEILERATSLDLEPAGALETLAHELAAGLSCRAAIKINHTLTLEEQRALIADLVATSNPFRCPHGRPIVLRLTQEEMERRLGRR